MKGLAHMINDIEAEVRLTRHCIGKSALDARVMDAMRRVPRDECVPLEYRHEAFQNGPVYIGHGQTISQPYIVALMTDLLDPEPDDCILEIGTGSCYQAAVLSLLVKQVYTVEIIPELAIQADERLKRLGYLNVATKIGDGFYGWPEHAPYDGIIVTAASPVIPAPLIEQLKAGGRLVIPVGLPFQYQELMVVKKDQGGELKTRGVLGVSFVPLTGGLGISEEPYPPKDESSEPRGEGGT